MGTLSIYVDLLFCQVFILFFPSQLDRLKEVSVREKNVYGIRPDCKLAQITPKIVELDLSRNLVASWDMVARICQHLPHLNNLHLRYSLAFLFCLRSECERECMLDRGERERESVCVCICVHEFMWLR